MNIGLSTSVVQRGMSGVGQYVLALVRALIPHARQHQFTLLVLEGDLPLFEFAKPHMELISVPERFRPPVKNILWHQLVLPRLARRIQLDVLHVPSYRRMLWPRPCALVATIHDLAPFRFAGKYDWRRILYGRVVARYLARRQDRIIAVSRTTARDVQGFLRVPPAQLSMIHNGLDHARFHPGSREEATAFVARGYNLSAPYFLFVSRLEHPAKNHVRLIEAFNQFKGATGSVWHLAFAGSDWHGAETIHSAIRHSPFCGDIHSLGFVGDGDLPQLYRAASALVCPSLFEGFGLPVLEAMACGCPVMCSASGSLAEIAGDAAVITDAEDVRTLKSALERLCTHNDLRLNLRARGIEHARQFDWHRTAAQTLEAYAHAAVATLPHGATVAWAAHPGCR